MNTVTVSRWGNSLGLRIPRGMLDAAGLMEGDRMFMEASEGVITIRKARVIKRHNLADMLAGFSSADVEPLEDWGEPQGREVW